MSIATLKKKTQTKYHNMSVSQSQFSLNGTLRNQGYIGQTSLSRTLVKTPMLGNVPKGHGGKNGAYLKTPIIQEASLFTTNDPTLVKYSVGHTSGDIAVQNPFLNCREYPCSHPIVKDLSNSNEEHIRSVKSKALNCPVVNLSGLYGDDLVLNGTFQGTVDTLGASSWQTVNVGGYIRLFNEIGTVVPTGTHTMFGLDVSNNLPGGIQQAVSFPKTGNYVLSFYARPIFNATSSSTLQASVGGTSWNVVSYTANTYMPWTFYKLPFRVDMAGSQNLTFLASALPTLTETFYIASVSIYTTDEPCYSMASFMFTKTKTKSNYTKVLTNADGAVKYNNSYADYLERIRSGCTLRASTLETTANHAPFAC